MLFAGTTFFVFCFLNTLSIPIDAPPPLSPSPELGQDPPGGSRIPTAPFIQTAVTEHEQHNVGIAEY